MSYLPPPLSLSLSLSITQQYSKDCLYQWLVILGSCSSMAGAAHCAYVWADLLHDHIRIHLQAHMLLWKCLSRLDPWVKCNILPVKSIMGSLKPDKIPSSLSVKHGCPFIIFFAFEHIRYLSTTGVTRRLVMAKTMPFPISWDLGKN